MLADIVYMVTGGSSLHQAYKLFGGTQSFGLSAWIVVFAATELLSCQVRPTPPHAAGIATWSCHTYQQHMHTFTLIHAILARPVEQGFPC